MLCRPVRKKKTEGLQYQQVPFEPRFSFRVSCLVKTVGRGWRLLYRETPAGRLTFFFAIVCATDLGITGHEKRLFSPDAKHTGAEKTRLKGFSTNRHQTSHGKGRDSCLVFRKKAVIRVSCLVSRENPLVAAGVALPGNASVPVDISFVCATDQASLDMRNRSSLLMPSRP